MSKRKKIQSGLPKIPWEDKNEKELGILWRYSGNPILGWNPIKNVARIFNSAVSIYDNRFVGIFRAEYINGRPHLHLGWSKDGLKWQIREDKIIWHDTQGNNYQPTYAYDPRLIKIENKFYIIWCTEFGGFPTIGVGVTTDFQTFTRLDNAFLPFNRNGVLFPRKIKDKYMMLSRPSDNGHTPFGDIFISESFDLIHWGKHRKVMSKGGYGWWQSLKIGGGPPPIETSEGWLMLYHGVNLTCNGYVYSIGGAILDIDQPSKVLYRSGNYLLTPEKNYETNGFVPNVVFPCATLYDKDSGHIAIYYGAADTYLGIAFTYINELIDFIKNTSELIPGDSEIIK
ncbi:MAG: glycosylase [Candidatus Thorarchaeota archaeon]